MQLHWILAALLIWCVVEVAPAAQKVRVGCLGQFPQGFYDAAVKCKLKLPAEAPEVTPKKGKRAAKPAVERIPPRAPITAENRAAAICVLKELKVQENGGVTYTEVRRYLDKHDAGSPLQKIWWRKVKDVAEVASNKNRSAKDANDMFVDGIYEEYQKTCAPSK